MACVSRGTLYRQKGTRNWSIQFQVDGKLQRESAGTSDREQALARLRQRTDEAKRGVFVEASKRITFEELHQRLLENYQFKRNRTHPSRHVKRLAESFGHLNACEINEQRIRVYSKKRLEEDGMRPATLRKELAILKRMLRLAGDEIPRVPLVDMPRVDNARQGFFEDEEVAALLPELPPHARNLVEFLYLTGWRSGEAFRLMWSDIDWIRKFVHLRDSKNREPRIFPFELCPELEALLLRQREQVSEWERSHSAICTAVFHWRGRPLAKLRRSWQTACRAANLPGRLLHDFRRTAVRNLIRAGVQQPLAMKITGHKTDSVFRRYLIIDEQLLAQAVGAVSEMRLDDRLRRQRRRD